MTAPATTPPSHEGAPSELAQWIADSAHRCVTDLALPDRDWAIIHAHLVLGRPVIVEALAAVPELAEARRKLAALGDRHQPVSWGDGSAVVVCSCTHAIAWDACPEGLILRGEA